MLVFNTREIGNKLLAVRKEAGMTQMEVAEAADLSNRAYADIERGSSNMRVDTMLRICSALHITPDEILTSSDEDFATQQGLLFERLNACSKRDQDIILKIISIFLNR